MQLLLYGTIVVYSYIYTVYIATYIMSPHDPMFWYAPECMQGRIATTIAVILEAVSLISSEVSGIYAVCAWGNYMLHTEDN